VFSLTEVLYIANILKTPEHQSTHQNPDLSIEMSIKVGNYLFTRLKQLGISTVFGVPGGTRLSKRIPCHN
jgi:hypothetical protein